MILPSAAGLWPLGLVPLCPCLYADAPLLPITIGHRGFALAKRAVSLEPPKVGADGAVEPRPPSVPSGLSHEQSSPFLDLPSPSDHSAGAGPCAWQSDRPHGRPSDVAWPFRSVAVRSPDLMPPPPFAKIKASFPLPLLYVDSFIVCMVHPPPNPPASLRWHGPPDRCVSDRDSCGQEWL